MFGKDIIESKKEKRGKKRRFPLIIMSLRSSRMIECLCLRTAARGTVERIVDLQRPILACWRVEGRPCPIVCIARFVSTVDSSLRFIEGRRTSEGKRRRDVRGEKAVEIGICYAMYDVPLKNVVGSRANGGLRASGTL